MSNDVSIFTDSVKYILLRTSLRATPSVFRLKSAKIADFFLLFNYKCRISIVGKTEILFIY